MTPTETQILALLERKPELTQFTPTYRWLIEAVEVLLRHQLELREDMRGRLTDELRLRLSKEITKEIMATLREDMRNNGILR